MRAAWLAPLLTAGLLLQGCDSVPNFPNGPLAADQVNKEPAPLIDRAGDDGVVVVLAISGGGSRAAALGLGVLEELAATRYSTPAGGVPLTHRVKAISSVSGGSVVAAWYGLAGDERLEEFHRFLASDNMRGLELKAAEPLTWWKLLFSSYGRIDVLSALLDKELFHGARMGALRRQGAPFIVMNATDMESGEVFSFTPQRFDDICSDLDQLPISAAVAASAAFPIALSPMNLKNYSYLGCPGPARPIPAWVTTDLTSPAEAFVNLEDYKRARYAYALRNGAGHFRDESYLHLLDGGLADNQGVQSLSEALIEPHSPLKALNSMALGQVKKIVVISVNARSDTDRGVGAKPDVPGLFSVVDTVIGVPIDSTTARANADMGQLIKDLGQWSQAQSVHFGVYGVAIDFDQFAPDQKPMQAEMKNIGTSWTLTPEQVEHSVEAGHLLLRQHPCFKRLLADLGQSGDEAAARAACRFPWDP